MYIHCSYPVSNNAPILFSRTYPTHSGTAMDCPLRPRCPGTSRDNPGCPSCGDRARSQSPRSKMSWDIPGQPRMSQLWRQGKVRRSIPAPFPPLGGPVLANSAFSSCLHSLVLNCCILCQHVLLCFCPTITLKHNLTRPNIIADA